MNYKSQTVSAVVITCNNASTLDRCLSSLHWVDELVIIDCGSNDNTVTIARAFTEHVHFHPSRNQTILRRDALSLATCDWTLLVEPDEWVEEMLKHEIDGVMLNTNPDIHGYTIPRLLKYQGQWVAKGNGSGERFLRLVRKDRWTVSEDWDAHLTVEGDVNRLDRPLGYAPYVTVADLFAAANHQSTLDAYRHLATRGVTGFQQNVLYLAFSTKWAFWKHYLFQGGMFGGFTGLTMTLLAGFQHFLTRAKMRTLTARKAT
jgi:glycosyltransferase involved in cell wall biosynthesis